MSSTSDSPSVNKKQRPGVVFINLLMYMLAVSAVMYTYIWNPSVLLKWMVGIVLLICLFLFGLKKNEPSPALQLQGSNVQAAPSGISKLAMLSEDGEKLKEWYIHGESSLLIGKRSADNEVEVDLADAEYAALISKQHAVLNYASDSWYLEDLDSRNGVGIKRKGTSTKQLLENEEPLKIESGDTIYIANTRLLVQ